MHLQAGHCWFRPIYDALQKAGDDVYYHSLSYFAVDPSWAGIASLADRWTYSSTAAADFKSWADRARAKGVDVCTPNAWTLDQKATAWALLPDGMRRTVTVFDSATVNEGWFEPEWQSLHPLKQWAKVLTERIKQVRELPWTPWQQGC